MSKSIGNYSKHVLYKTSELFQDCKTMVDHLRSIFEVDGKTIRH